MIQILILTLQEFKNWDYVGTEGYISPGIISKKSYKNADVWALITTLYVLVEGVFIFDSSKETTKDFDLRVVKGSRGFKTFISNMIDDIFDDAFFHKKLMKCYWMRC